MISTYLHAEAGGILITWPGKIRFGLGICGLNLISQSNGIPLRFAILKSVSPERIVYSVPPGGQGTVVGTHAEAGGIQMT